MRNNNAAIINKLADSALRANRGRNKFLVLAITLTTLMLCTLFNVGMSYLESIKAQEIRLVGSAAHASLQYPSQKELEGLKGLDYVKYSGTRLYVGQIEKTEQIKDTELSLYCYDSVQWEELSSPAFTDIHGAYPQAEDEIMIPSWVLDKIGIENPEIGMSVTLSVSLKNGDGFEERAFTLSGWYTSYMHAFSSGYDMLLVSQSLAEKTGRTLETDGSASIRFKDDNVDKYKQLLARDLDLSDPDRIGLVYIYTNTSSSTVTGIIAVCIIILFLMFTGYLLIYNVLYISVAKDIRFFGLLKAVGMTSRQIKSTVYRQILRLCLFGIPAGLILSAVVSYVLIPALLKSFLIAGSIDTGTVVSFSPLIYIGASLFALITALIGVMRPARRAARISPVEAVRFSGVKGGRKVTMRGSLHGNTFKMALRNVFRSRRQAFLVFLSMFFGLTTFMIITTMVKSMDTDNFIASYVDSDIILTNERSRWITTEERQRITPEMIEAIKKLPGLTDIRIHYAECGTMKYDAHAFADYIKYQNSQFDIGSFFGTDVITDEVIQQNFLCYVNGLDRSDIEEINKTLDNPIDAEAFVNGDFALTDTEDPELFDTVKEFEVSLIPSEVTLKIPLGGFIAPWKYGIGGGYAPSVYVSSALLEELLENPVIAKVELEVEEKWQENAVGTIKSLTRQSFDITRISRVETREMFTNVKVMMLILGDGIAVILGLIGVLNFVSITSTGVYARKRELALLESLGQSKRQIRRMLANEGAVYALISIVLVGIFGGPATYGLFRMFATQADYAVFSFPYVTMAVIVLLVIGICLITPNIIYRSVAKATVIERLRESE